MQSKNLFPSRQIRKKITLCYCPTLYIYCIFQVGANRVTFSGKQLLDDCSKIKHDIYWSHTSVCSRALADFIPGRYDVENSRCAERGHSLNAENCLSFSVCFAVVICVWTVFILGRRGLYCSERNFMQSCFVFCRSVHLVETKHEKQC